MKREKLKINFELLMTILKCSKSLNWSDSVVMSFRVGSDKLLNEGNDWKWFTMLEWIFDEDDMCITLKFRYGISTKANSLPANTNFHSSENNHELYYDFRLNGDDKIYSQILRTPAGGNITNLFIAQTKLN